MDVTYNVDGNEVTSPGRYYMTLSGTSNFSGTKVIHFGVLGDTDDDIKSLGDITAEVKSDDTSCEGEFVTSLADIVKQTVTADEISNAVMGGRIRIWVSITDISKTISADSKKALDSAAKENECDVAQYNDISMYKQVGSTAVQQISQTSTPVEIMLTIPENMRPDKTLESRTFGLIRNHEDEVEVMPTTYNSEKFVLDFATDKFSDYALTKVDVAHKDDPEEPGDEPTIEPQTDSSAKTGDVTTMCLYGMLILAGLFGLAICSLARRKSKRN